MTFSIVATDGTAWGVAVASKFLAVGNAVPAAEAGVGAIATQSYANLSYRPNGLRLLREGSSAQQTLDRLVGEDDLREQRQAGIVDARGGSATYTGEGCHDWAGGVTGTGTGTGSGSGDDCTAYAIQGNILTGPEVVAAMERAWLDSDPALPFARRLLAALVAGDAAGGDRRGRQSAAVLVVAPDGGYGGESDVVADLRVDDAAAPIPELARLLDLHDLYFTKPDPAQALTLEGELADEVRRRLAALGHTATGDGASDLDKALADWAGVENYEERLLPGRIDPVVLEQLRALGS